MKGNSQGLIEAASLHSSGITEENDDVPKNFRYKTWGSNGAPPEYKSEAQRLVPVCSVLHVMIVLKQISERYCNCEL